MVRLREREGEAPNASATTQTFGVFAGGMHIFKFFYFFIKS